jgi:hypothetical protein
VWRVAEVGFAVAQSMDAMYIPSEGRARARLGRRSRATMRLGSAPWTSLVVPMINFRLLSVLVILRHEQRRLISLNITDQPTAESIAQQITEAFPWDEAQTGIIRDSDARYGHAAERRLAAMANAITRRPGGDLGRTGTRRD